MCRSTQNRRISTRPSARSRSLKPDVVFSTVVGQSTAIFYEAYRRAGFDPNKMPIASLTTSEAEVAEMSPGAAEGHITAAPFFEALATPAARRFISAYKLRYGPNAPVTAGAEAAYFQVHLAAAALARAGTDDPERLLPALRDAEFDAPQGRVRIDASNNHTYLWPRVARLDAKGAFQIVWNPGRARQTGPVLRRHEPRRLVGGSPAADPRLSGGAVAIRVLRDLRGLRVQVDSSARRRRCRTRRAFAPDRLHGRSAMADPGRLLADRRRGSSCHRLRTPRRSFTPAARTARSKADADRRRRLRKPVNASARSGIRARLRSSSGRFGRSDCSPTS